MIPGFIEGLEQLSFGDRPYFYSIRWGMGPGAGGIDTKRQHHFRN
jgi:hypothetical protein